MKRFDFIQNPSVRDHMTKKYNEETVDFSNPEIGPQPMTPNPYEGTPSSDAFAAKPVDPRALDALSKSNPGLVEQYKARMAAADQGVKDAQAKQDTNNMINAFGQAGTMLTNALSKPVILDNRMQDLGKAPTVIEQEKATWDGSQLDNMGKQGLARAESARSQAEQGFLREQALGDQELERGDKARARQKSLEQDDPNSAESALARDYLKQIAPNSSKMPGFDNLSASQIQKVAPGLFDKYKADMTERNADKRLKAQLDAEGRKHQAPAEQFKSLPVDSQEVIKELSKKNASKESIANQIDSMIQVADQASDPSQKLAIYRQMGKVLNSTEGQDAVGSEEAKTAPKQA
jgi:hypothetical protein